MPKNGLFRSKFPKSPNAGDSAPNLLLDSITRECGKPTISIEHFWLMQMLENLGAK